eukprot:9471739-Pyramimonas_sp.AAC.2
MTAGATRGTEPGPGKRGKRSSKSRNRRKRSRDRGGAEREKGGRTGNTWKRIRIRTTRKKMRAEMREGGATVED